MKRLTFKKIGKYCYEIHNKGKDLIGFIERIRTGAFMHYCLTIPYILCEECADRSEGLTFSPGCQDEIRAFCKKKNSDALNVSNEGDGK